LSRGRRLESAGFGAFLGIVAFRQSPWLAFGLMLVLIFGGCWLQFRAEKKHKAALPTEGAE
jgi:FtsH-binding integral membrane protein